MPHATIATEAEPKPPEATAGIDEVDPVDEHPRRAGRRRSARALAVAFVAVIAGSGLFVSGFALGSLRATTPGTPVSEQQAFQPFWDAYRSATTNFAGTPVDRKTIIDGAIRGMIASLGDPFSAYMSPEEYRKSLEGLSSTFEGVGATLQATPTSGQGSCTTLGSGCSLVVVSTISGAPAEKAGLLAGDVVLQIDHASLDGLTPDKALAKVRGPRGTPVVLTISRGSTATFDLTITRDVIVIPSVESRTLAGGTVGYIKLAGFSDQAATDFAAAVATDVKAGRKKLVVDLRGNLGGYVQDAQKVLSQFVVAGTTIFWQQDAAGHQTPTAALGGGLATDPSIQLVVLVDGNSASASEIVAGALQDLGRAKLVGQKSYGKGTIQVWQQLPDDNGGFRLTIARWLTPNKRWINGTGLQPDIAVSVPASVAPGVDPVLDRGLQELGAATGATGDIEPIEAAA